MDGDTQEISEPLKHEEMSETTDSAEVSTRPVPPPRRHRSGVNEPDMNTTASTTPLIESSSPEKPSPLAEDLNSPKAQRLHQHHDENFDDFEDDCIPGVVYKPTTLGSQGVTTKTTMGTIRELYSSSPKITDFWRNLKEFVTTMGNPAFWIAVNAIFIFFSLVVMIIGFVYVNNCPMERNVPVFLIVGAVLLIFKSSLKIFTISRAMKRKLRRPDGVIPSKCITLVIPAAETLIVAFLFAWFVAGCVWIYGNYNFVAYNRPDVLSDLGKLSSEDKFCHQALYTVAFVVLTAFLIFFSAVIIGVVILSVYLCVQSSSKKF